MADASGTFGVLSPWCAALAALVRAETPDLSTRQLAILMTVHLHPGPHTVRGLASHLAISKPAVSRALDTLGGLDLVQRRRDPTDRRNVLIRGTPSGVVFLEEVARLLSGAADECCEHQVERQRSA